MAFFDKISINGTYYNVKDTAAQKKIDAETTAREQADTALESKLESELESKIGEVPKTPEQFGAVGDGQTDDTEAFNAMFATGVGFYVCGRGKNYKISGNVACSTDCTLDLNGSTIYLTQHAIQTDEVRNFQFTASKIEIYNGVVDGNGADQWNTDISSMLACYAINISASIVTIRNMTFQNIWGYAVRIENATCVTVSESEFVNVGGHYKTNNEYDMFGDAIYIGTASVRQNVNIQGCKISGRSSGTTLSRSAITIEYGDQPRIIVVENTTIEKYDRAFHTEEVGRVDASFVSCSITNVNVLAFWWNDDTSDSGSNTVVYSGCEIVTTGNDYNGTRGIRGFRQVLFINTTVSYSGCLVFSGSNTQYDLLSFINSSVLVYKNGNAAQSPLVETVTSGTMRVGFYNSRLEAVTSEMGSFLPARTTLLIVGSQFAAGAQGWSGSVPECNAVASEVTGITGFKTAKFE